MEKHLVCELEALKQQKKLRVMVDKTPVLLALDGDKVYAIDDKCPHMKASLSKGTLEGKTITCKAHKAAFDLETGEVINKAKLLFLKMPTKKAKTYETIVEGNKVYLNM